MKRIAIALALCSIWSAGYAEPVSMQQVNALDGVAKSYTSQDLVQLAVQKKDARNGGQDQSVVHMRIGADGITSETSSDKLKAVDTPVSGKSEATASSPAQPQPVQPQARLSIVRPATTANPSVATTPVQPAQVQQGIGQRTTDTHNQPFKGNNALADSMYGSGGGNVRQIGAKIPPPGPKHGVQAQTLPGVGVMPGDSPDLENNVIRVSSDRTQIVNVSGTLTNRIATPFEKPKAILLDGAASVKAVGQSLYIAPNGNPAPISLYVTGNGTNDPVVSLTLVPKSMPPQTIVLQMDGPINPASGGAQASGRKENTQSEVYTESIVATLRSLALGKVPQGYAEGILPKAVANMGSVVAIPLARYSGPYFDIYRYRVEAIVNGALEMEESAFWAKGVRAVAFYPTGVIAKNKPTQVFVVADKSATEVGGSR